MLRVICLDGADTADRDGGLLGPQRDCCGEPADCMPSLK
jgi:hypothetical protein